MTTTQQGEPLLVRDARKRFGDVEALAGDSLEVRRGELVELLGPNGAGKTTMIRAISGRGALDSGSIQLFGRTVTARENLEAFGVLYGVQGADVKTRVDWAREWSDLKDRAKESVKRFSSGMKRRLNIAIGLMHSPAIVLLDEPTVGVDPQSRERIYEMLASLQASGVGVVLATHHLEDAERRCERIVIIDRGRIVAAGTLGELLAAARSGGRALTMVLEAPWPAAAAVPDGFSLSADRLTVTVAVEDGGRGVAARIDTVTGLGARVQDLSLAGASLQDVFIGLTGRELRE